MISPDLSDLEQIVNLTTSVETIDCSSDNIHIVCGQGTIVRIYDLQFNPIGCDMIGHQNKIKVVKYSPNGSLIGSGSSHSQVCIWDSKTQVNIYNFVAQHDNSITCLSFSSNGQHLAVGGKDMRIKIINVSQITIKEDFEILKAKDLNTLRQIEYSPDCNKLISCTNSRAILLWDLRHMKCQKINFQNAINFVTYINKQVLILNSNDKTIKIWVERNQKLLRKFRLSAHQIILTPDKKNVLCLNRVWKTMILKNIETGQAIGIFIYDDRPQIQCLVFSNDGKSIITGNYHMTVSIISLEAFEKDLI